MYLEGLPRSVRIHTSHVGESLLCGLKTPLRGLWSTLTTAKNSKIYIILQQSQPSASESSLLRKTILLALRLAHSQNRAQLFFAILVDFEINLLRKFFCRNWFRLCTSRRKQLLVKGVSSAVTLENALDSAIASQCQMGSKRNPTVLRTNCTLKSCSIYFSRFA